MKLCAAAVFVVGLMAVRATEEQCTCSGIQAEIDNAEAVVHQLNATLTSLARQLVLSQLYIEEMTRSAVDSGIKQVRNNGEGTRPYYGHSYTGYSMAAIHDHANNVRTIGMGELVAVLNGVEFRTRHNDYRTYQPSLTSSDMDAYSEVEFPPVPPEVLAKETIEEQIIEMREWFKAWQEDDTSPRDYRPYFRPMMSYLEGAWYYSGDQIQDPLSDRHHIDASSYYDLEEKNRYSATTGTKTQGENLAFLPRAIMNVTESGTPVYGQWNYRIMCHPIQRELPLNRLRAVGDMKAQMVNKKSFDDWPMDKAARFTLNVWDNDAFVDRQGNAKLLEMLMNEIPGKDNYGAYILDPGMGNGVSYDSYDKTKLLNTGYYSRRYASIEPDAMGSQTSNRGFDDQYMYMAQTTQDDVFGMDNPNCIYGKQDNCDTPEALHQKWTYAVPLEIIYMTPLNGWNPYNITYKGNAWSTEGKTVTEGGRDGTENKPYNGASHNNYHITPTEMFDYDETNPDPADTTPAGTVHVLDAEGNTRKVKSSGFRIFFPEIQGLGVIRQRYPIVPVSDEGSAVSKELEALQDIMLSSQTHAHMFYDDINPTTTTSTTSTTTQPTTTTPPLPGCSLSGDPREELGMLNNRGGNWFNLFEDLLFQDDTQIQGVEYYSFGSGTAYVSFWRSEGDKLWTMVNKIELTSTNDTAGVMTHYLPASEWFTVPAGTVIATHYPPGESGRILYETTAADYTEGLNYESLWSSRAMNVLDDGWQPGYSMNVTSGISRKAVGLKVMGDCVRGDCNQIDISGMVVSEQLNKIGTYDKLPIEEYCDGAHPSYKRTGGSHWFYYYADKNEWRISSQNCANWGGVVAKQVDPRETDPSVMADSAHWVEWSPEDGVQLDAPGIRLTCTDLHRDCSPGGEPRGTCGRMNSDPWNWLNVFTTVTFPSDTVVKGAEFYAMRSGGVYFSFWRASASGANMWTMVENMFVNVTDNTEGVWTHTLSPEQWISVQQGDSVGIHYPKGTQSGIVAMEKSSENRTEGLTSGNLHPYLNKELHDDSLYPGGEFNLGNAITSNTRTASFKVIGDCVWME